MIWLKQLFFALVALAIIQIVYYYPQIPDTVASHFDGLGAPNAWSSKAGFFGLYAVILLMVVVVFVFVPGWSEKRIGFGMNIPHREHWLAPERIEATRQFFRRQMLLMGIVHLALALVVMQLAILANFDPQPRLHGSVYWALVLYFVFLIAWLIHFFLHFKRP